MSLNIDQEQRLIEALEIIQDEKLYGWDKQFITDLREKFEDQGADIFITHKMWNQIDRIAGRF